MQRRAWVAIGMAIGLSGVPFVDRPKPATVSAVALVKDLPAGSLLTLDDFAVRDVPVSVPSTSLLEAGRAAELVGKPLRHALHAGDLLRAVDVAARPDPVPEGFRLVSVNLGPGRTSGSRRGDRVDVIAVTQGTGHTVVGDVEVRDVFGDVEQPTIAMLRVRAADAERLLLASEASAVFLSLRAPGDTEPADLERKVTLETLLRPPPLAHGCRFRPLRLIRGN